MAYRKPSTKNSPGIKISPRRTLALVGVCVAIFAVGMAILLPGISSPTGYDFDEAWYVPAARAMLDGNTSHIREHPPVGKYLMAGSIALAGDSPLGWRLMSVIFGSLTLVGLWLFSFFVFETTIKNRDSKSRSMEASLVAVVCAVLGQLWFVQARVGMIDIFLLAFVIWSLAAGVASVDSVFSPKARRHWLVAAGVLFGLALATKWSALPVGLLLLAMTIFARKSKDENTGGITGKQILLLVGALPVTVYAAIFIPFLFLEPKTGILDIVSQHLNLGQKVATIQAFHPYASRWWEWPLMTRPVWYAFEADATREHAAVVFLVGNIVVMWSGLLALGWSVFRFFKGTSDLADWIVFATWAALYLFWAVVPREFTFFYYYLPASLILCTAIGLAWIRIRQQRNQLLAGVTAVCFLTPAVGVFLWFLPVISGSTIAAVDYPKWIWMNSWSISTKKSATDSEQAILKQN